MINYEIAESTDSETVTIKPETRTWVSHCITHKLQSARKLWQMPFLSSYRQKN